MRHVLLDENLPRKLRRELPECLVRTVQETGWTSFANGELLVRAQAEFDVLLTADRRLQFQQNPARFDIGIVVILTPSLRFRNQNGNRGYPISSRDGFAGRTDPGSGAVRSPVRLPAIAHRLRSPTAVQA